MSSKTVEFLQRFIYPAVLIFLFTGWLCFIFNEIREWHDGMVPEFEFANASEFDKLPHKSAIFTINSTETYSEWFVGNTALSEEKMKNAPLSKLNIRLAGIVSHGDCISSLAILEQEQKQQSYGCEVIDAKQGIKIEMIFPDMIIISHGGYYESLRIDLPAA